MIRSRDKWADCWNSIILDQSNNDDEDDGRTSEWPTHPARHPANQIKLNFRTCPFHTAAAFQTSFVIISLQPFT
jgi:hypothetical protein